MKPTIINNRRFTVLSPTLVRMEFASDGVFEDRNSLVAYAAKEPMSPACIREEGRWTILETGSMQIHSRNHTCAFDRNTVEIRFIRKKCA